MLNNLLEFKYSYLRLKQYGGSTEIHMNSLLKNVFFLSLALEH